MDGTDRRGTRARRVWWLERPRRCGNEFGAERRGNDRVSAPADGAHQGAAYAASDHNQTEHIRDDPDRWGRSNHLSIHTRPSGRQHLLWALRCRVAPGADEGFPEPNGRANRRDRDDPPAQRGRTGHLRLPSALLLRPGRPAGRDPVPKRRRVRRHLARRLATRHADSLTVPDPGIENVSPRGLICRHTEPKELTSDRTPVTDRPRQPAVRESADRLADVVLIQGVTLCLPKQRLGIGIG